MVMVPSTEITNLTYNLVYANSSNMTKQACIDNIGLVVVNLELELEHACTFLKTKLINLTYHLVLDFKFGKNTTITN